jgi:DNA-binding SARP family transcriptional activator
MGETIEAGVLGVLKLALGERDATPTAQKQRQVLSLLLMRGPRAVSLSTLIEELWHDAPPRSATTVVQTYILSLRKNIAEHLGVEQAVVAAELLRTSNKGYLFDIDGGRFDLCDYRNLVDASRAALSTGDDERAVRCLEDAEQLWRGPALADVECGVPLAAEVARLEHTRLVALELRIEAALRLGLYRDVCADLCGLIIRYPFHEKLHAYLMFALCRAGWRRRALEVFHALRRSMIDELGLEPCAEVQRLHHDILSASDQEVAAMLGRRHASYLTELFPRDAAADGRTGLALSTACHGSTMVSLP